MLADAEEDEDFIPQKKKVTELALVIVEEPPLPDPIDIDEEDARVLFYIDNKIAGLLYGSLIYFGDEVQTNDDYPQPVVMQVNQALKKLDQNYPVEVLNFYKKADTSSKFFKVVTAPQFFWKMSQYLSPIFFVVCDDACRACNGFYGFIHSPAETISITLWSNHENHLLSEIKRQNVKGIRLRSTTLSGGSRACTFHSLTVTKHNNYKKWIFQLLHYIVRGPEESPYTGGLYHGKLKFPSEFPFKPPSIYMITPSGRFKVNVRLCLSISDFHPDTWNPAWSVGTILTGLLSFMLEKSPTLGSIESTEAEKRALAFKSLEFNLKDKIVVDLFPEIVDEMKATIEKRKAQLLSRGGTQTNFPSSSAASNQGSSSNFQSVVATAVVAFAFAFFAYSVKYVLNVSAMSD